MSGRIHSIKCLTLCCAVLSLTILIGNGQSDDDSNNIVLVLESRTQDQNPDLKKYRCTIKKSQMQSSTIVHDLVVDDNDDHDELSHIEIPLPYYENQQFFKSGFHDMCNYIQTNIFNQHYNETKHQLPMPLLLDNQNHFYNLEQLTEYEIQFMKQVESFDSDNNNPFDIDITRMNNLFKLADFLQMERLVTIIAARQASLMMNMTKQEMIDWLIDNQNTKKQVVADNNNNYKQDSNDNLKMVPLLTTQLQSCSDDNNHDEECITNEVILNKYHSGLLPHILQFFSCCDIHTFSSISNDFYQLARELNVFESSIDEMIKILTNNNDSTCLSLTNQEIIFYKPFLTLTQSRWTENQNNTFDRLKTMTNSKINVNSKYQFKFDVLGSRGEKYFFWPIVSYIYHENIVISCSGRLSIISFKFGNFSQQLNTVAQSRNIQHIAILFDSTPSFLSSFDDLIGINDIKNIKKIEITRHSLSFIDFEKIYKINNQLEYLKIVLYQSTSTCPVKNMQFLSKLKSLKELDLDRNNLDVFDFDTLKGLTNLEVLKITRNRFKYTSNTKCLDFSFLTHLSNFDILDLSDNQIECLLGLNAFQGTNIRYIRLEHNKLSSFSDGDNTSQLQPCLDFNSFDNMRQLVYLNLGYNKITCIINFESIQQHTQLANLDLAGNHLLSSIDFTRFDDSKPFMNNLLYIHFENMNLKYTIKNNNCLDLQFLKFMPQVSLLDLSNNKIECVDNVSILQREDVKLERLWLNSTTLVSFDLADLIGSNVKQIDLTNNNLSFESVKNFDRKTLSKINHAQPVQINIKKGNDDKFSQITTITKYGVGSFFKR